MNGMARLSLIRPFTGNSSSTLGVVNIVVRLQVRLLENAEADILPFREGLRDVDAHCLPLLGVKKALVRRRILLALRLSQSHQQRHLRVSDGLDRAAHVLSGLNDCTVNRSFRYGSQSALHGRGLLEDHAPDLLSEVRSNRNDKQSRAAHPVLDEVRMHPIVDGDISVPVTRCSGTHRNRI